MLPPQTQLLEKRERRNGSSFEFMFMLLVKVISILFFQHMLIYDYLPLSFAIQVKLELSPGSHTLFFM